MRQAHTVVQGECLSSVAQHGFADRRRNYSDPRTHERHVIKARLPPVVLRACRFFLWLLIVLNAGAAHAAAPATIQIWPGLKEVKPDEIANNRIVAVHNPTLTVYAPEKPNGTAVIFSPGGGYHHLTIGENGGPETQWFNSLGVTVFMLKYRVQTQHPAPLRDVLRAIRIVRSRAAEFRVKPDRIGVFGASAGGHLAACASTLWADPIGQTGADIDAVNARPDFAILIYAVITMESGVTHKGSRENLLGANPSPELIEHLSLQKQVRKDTPPTFLVATMADSAVPVENTLQFYQALRNAKVSAELHVYAQGSHGNSLDPQYGPTARWPQRAEEWMRFNGWLSAGN
jgi:acetyl esterase/lipase